MTSFLRYFLTHHNATLITISQWSLQMTVAWKSQADSMVTSSDDASECNSQTDVSVESANDDHFRVIMWQMKDIQFWFTVVPTTLVTICNAKLALHQLAVLQEKYLYVTSYNYYTFVWILTINIIDQKLAFFVCCSSWAHKCLLKINCWKCKNKMQKRMKN